MALIACGINHKTAPIAVREKLVFSLDNTPTALHDLLQLDAVNEAVILSTCNRTELYSDALQPRIILDWLAKQHGLSPQELETYSYSYSDQAAIKHLMRVATSLDSMVVGEPQILGQIKQAFQLAQQTGAIGKYLARLFPAIFAVTKQVRNKTDIGVSPVSIAYASVILTKQIFANLNKCNVFILGAGETVKLVARHLQTAGIQQLIIANRSLNKAQHLAAQFNATAIELRDMPVYLHQADIVITAVHTDFPLIGKGIIESAIKARKHRPMLMIDLGVPRNIEAEVAKLEDAYLYNIDDLQKIVTHNVTKRHSAAIQADSLIEVQAAHLMRQLQALNANDTICSYRKKIEQFGEQELTKAKLALQAGRSGNLVLETLVRNITQKITHAPSVQLRQAAYDGRFKILLLARQLLAIDE